MGFTTGFTGGVTLTLGIAYLTVLAHERNRQAQSHSLRSQTRVLNSLIDPAPLPPPRTRAELAREERGTFVETAKDRWNAEIEGAVRWVQRMDWDEVREQMEGSVARLLGGGLEKSRTGIEEAEKQAGPKVQETIERSRDAAKRGADGAMAGIDRAAAATIAGAEKAGAEAKSAATKVAGSVGAQADKAGASAKRGISEAEAKASRYADKAKATADKSVADAKSGLHEAADSIRASGGTIDAARSTVRDAISKGIEKGKELLGKAQETAGFVAEETKAKIPALQSSSPVEKALEQRYEKSNELNKSVEQALAERYTPVDSRDNGVLRGV